MGSLIPPLPKPFSETTLARRKKMSQGTEKKVCLGLKKMVSCQPPKTPPLSFVSFQNELSAAYIYASTLILGGGCCPKFFEGLKRKKMLHEDRMQGWSGRPKSGARRSFFVGGCGGRCGQKIILGGVGECGGQKKICFLCGGGREKPFVLWEW